MLSSRCVPLTESLMSEAFSPRGTQWKADFRRAVLADIQCHFPSLPVPFPSLSPDITTTDLKALVLLLLFLAKLVTSAFREALQTGVGQEFPLLPSEQLQPRPIPALWGSGCSAGHETSLGGLTPSLLFSLAMRLMGSVKV